MNHPDRDAPLSDSEIIELQNRLICDDVAVSEDDLRDADCCLSELLAARRREQTVREFCNEPVRHGNCEERVLALLDATADQKRSMHDDQHDGLCQCPICDPAGAKFFGEE